MLPDYIRQRPKNPMSHSSGLHERVRLYKPLFAGSTGPSATTCSADAPGLLGRAGARATTTWTGPWPTPRTPGDYTRAEHARDLAGALKWNVINGVRATRRRLTRR